MDPATWVMVALLYYQVTMPANENGVYTFNIDPKDSSLVIFNTRNSKMWRCSRELVCDPGLELDVKAIKKD